ncbi:unnamed protein product [Phytophthora lilii]|uniref:Unnamed protein product n=1 Tax=Phytophthora lilii TaxID=2077276 RepID=A0A9W6WZQ6_9STRA|nr:unnamed protein product [Phytophthora lilii]
MLSDKLEQLTNSRLTDGVADLKWQVLASKELEARLQAEAQQRQVRMVIERRCNAMQKLQEVLHMHEDKKTVKENWGSDDFALYKNFHYEITAAYAQTDAILNASGLDGAVPSNTSFYKPVRSRDELRNLNFFESTSAFTIPSSYPKPAVAMFDSMREVHRLHPERHLYEVGDDISNTIAVKFGTVYHCNAGKVVPLALIIVMRRFVEYHRTVLVWRCLIQGDGEFIGTFLDSTGWCVLRPTSSGGIASTDVRTCIRLVPTQMSLTKTIEADDTGSIQDAEVFTEAVVRSSQQDKLKLTYIMEKMLLESK